MKVISRYLSLAASVFALVGTQTLISTAMGASGGSSEGNGGGGFLCSDRVLLLDLWEAQVPGLLAPNGLTIINSAQSTSVQMSQAIVRLQGIAPELAGAVRQEIQNIKGIIHPIPSDSELRFPTDVKRSLTKKGCKPVGIAEYDDLEKKLWVDRELISQMHPTDQAALFIHEGIYKVFRTILRETNSRRARILTGYLFSTTPIPTHIAGIPLRGYRCQTIENSPFSALVSSPAPGYVQILLADRDGVFSQNSKAIVFQNDLVSTELERTFHLKSFSTSSEMGAVLIGQTNSDGALDLRLNFQKGYNDPKYQTFCHENMYAEFYQAVQKI